MISLSRFFDTSQKELNKIKPLVEEINRLEKKYEKLKDGDFPKRTEEFRKRLAKGETLNDLAPEALALIREAIKRVVGERAFDVQLSAAIVLHQGMVAEQKTGEGKTLSSTLTAYLNGLTGKGVHIVTVNDYLARRDAGWYGQALHFAGLSIGCIIHEQAFLFDPDFSEAGQEDERLRHLKEVPRREAYVADITYGTNNEFGFDYLRDNMARRLEDKTQRGHHFTIVDEVDSILIDEARTPLIISSPDTEPTEKYFQFARLINSLSGEADFEMDEKMKSAQLTEHGVKKVEKILKVDNLYEKDFDTLHHIENALRARSLFLKDREYVVKEDQVIIVDEFTGRLMPGRRWSDGLHQAVEAKEGVKIQQESITLATISFQNYFRMYQKLAGMTGTAATEAEEFRKIYKLEVVIIPTNRPMVRKDKQDFVYKTQRAKYAAIVGEVEDCYRRGQPVLVGTTSIEKNEIVDRYLSKKKIPHNVLNAKSHEKEAKILAQAGKKRAVTVATNMAGRGVDIILGGALAEGAGKKATAEWQDKHKEIIELGGLHVVGTERHESRRIDNQLRGRAGRQGDPGSSRFFLSLEDDLMRLFGGEQISKIMEMLKIPEDQPIEHGMVSRVIEGSQSKVESFHFDNRKRVVEFDDVMNRQREVIYGKRDEILRQFQEKKKGKLKKKTLAVLEKQIGYVLSSQGSEAKPNYSQLVNSFCEILPLEENSQKELEKRLSKSGEEKNQQHLMELAEKAYSIKEKELGEEIMTEAEKFVWLQSIDRLWIDHLDMLDDLRESVSLRGYAQKDPLVEYKKEAFSSFEGLLDSVETQVAKRIFRIQTTRPVQPVINLAQAQTNIDPQDKMGLAQKNQRSRVKKKKIGRNDPCWCGSGKKWKKCHYPQLD